MQQLFCIPLVREVGEDAGWRTSPLSHADAIERVVVKTGALDPLLQAPWVKTSIFKMDWLHAADQGITADFIGNVLFQLVAKFPGNKDEQYKGLFAQIQEYYEDEKVDDRLDFLKPSFIEGRQGMKLRCSAAKCRKLVPCVRRLTAELCDTRNIEEQAMMVASYHLNRVYENLSAATHDPLAFKADSIKFASQYVALHDFFNDDKLFVIKPKMHFFLHLCSDGGLPSFHWCYRDEDFGGSVAKAAHRRGGCLSVQATSSGVLQKMKMGTPRVAIV